MSLPWHRRPTTWLWLMIGVYIAVFSAACLRKYGLFLYDGIDLAYFSQVFWNFLRGQPFVQTIHPHLSLGDHAELAIPLLLPLYAFWPGPRVLLIIQTAALALSAWPVYLLAKQRFTHPARKSTSQLLNFSTSQLLNFSPLALAAAWLAGPIVQNINLYEFHILPFAILPLLFALLAYDRGQKIRFLIFAALAMLVREDVALVVATFGLLAWLEKKPLWWRIVPAAAGLAWFAFDMALIGHFAPAGGYKFAVYYAWLGSTPLEILLNVFRHPLRLAGHLLTFANFEMFLGLLMAAGFLPLLRPRRLILAAAPLAIILLGAPGGGELVLETHYASLFLPALFAAAIDGAVVLPEIVRRVDRRWPRFGLFVPLTAAASVLSAAAAFGPLPAVPGLIRPNAMTSIRAEAAAGLVARVPAGASVAAGYRLLPALASRPELYSAHYQFLGVTQFAEKPYSLPPDVRFFAWDAGDALNYAASFPSSTWAASSMDGGFSRLRKLALREPVYSSGQFMLYDKMSAGISGPSPAVVAPPRQDLGNGLRLNGFAQTVSTDDQGRPVWNLLLVWNAATPQPDGLAMEISLIDTNGRRWPRGTYPLNQGLVGPRELASVPASLPITIRLDDLPAGKYLPAIEAKNESAVLLLDEARDIERRVVSSRSLGTAMLAEITR